ncbi:Lipase -like protein [Toxocara canis]|uniref:Lipase-like protein n=1 Tax=Toxocara canis TaxID=6265 RepID=A0A0B2VY31_TOXCA|nr:Lipase -like protein [Toxocara canis]
MLVPLMLFSATLTMAFTENCSNASSCSSCVKITNKYQLPICVWCSTSKTCVGRWTLHCQYDRIIEQLECPSQPLLGYEYEDAFARNKMFPLSAAAHSTNPQLCLSNALDNAQLIRQITVRCDSVMYDNCSAYTAVSHAFGAIVISFRGTDGFVQLVNQGLTTIFSPEIDLQGAGKINKYFYDAFLCLWTAGLKNDLLAVIKKNPSYDLWITGYSLGGAMASIASTIIVRDGIYKAEKVKLVTFGQPRTGDHEYALTHNKLLYYTYRVIHQNDIVPHIPPKNFKGYYHHLYEVWYNNSMDSGDPYVICTTPECIDSNKKNLSIQDHLNYFGKNVVDYGDSGCE